MTTDLLARMELSGYVSFSSHGFSLPAYRAGSNANAWYTALPVVDGDRAGQIIGFELLQEIEPLPLPRSKIVCLGDRWQDVFIWENTHYVGDPEDILAQLDPFVEHVKFELPLSFLDLALATAYQDTADLAREAKTHLCNTLGDEVASVAYQDLVVKKGVLLEVNRRVAESRIEVTDRFFLRDFSIIEDESSRFKITFGKPLGNLFSSSEKASLAGAIEAFGQRIGIELEVLGLEPVENTATVEPPPEPNFAPSSVVRTGASVPTRLFGLAREVAIDLGTSTTKIYARKQGIVLVEPSVVAVRYVNGRKYLLAVGSEASIMADKTPDDIEVVRPIRDGAIADIDLAVEMIKYFVRKVKSQRRWFRPLDLIICVPSGSTSTERRAIRDAARNAGASQVFLILEPMAAAIGADMPISEPIASIIVNIGGGTTEIGLISLNGLAYTVSVRSGGDRMDEAIVSYVRRSHNLLIGISSAERIKRDHGVVFRDSSSEANEIVVRGRCVTNGVPKEITIRQAEIADALAEPIGVIVEAIRIILENAAPELAADIVDQGIVLTGGGALLSGLDDLIRDETGLPVHIAAEPLECVAIGMGRAMEDPAFRDILLKT